MTDQIADASPVDTGLHTSDAAHQRLKARYRAEARFKYLGVAAISVSGLFLILLLSTIIGNALPAFRAHYLTVPLQLPDAETLASNYEKPIRESLYAQFPGASSRKDKKLLRGLVSSGSGYALRRAVEAESVVPGQNVEFAVPVDDFSDLYLKGLVAEKDAPQTLAGVATPTGTSGDIAVVVEANAFNDLLKEVKADLLIQSGNLLNQAGLQQRQLERLSGQLNAVIAQQPEAEGEDVGRLAERSKVLTADIAVVEARIAGLQDQAKALRERGSALTGSEVLGNDYPSLLLNINGGVVKVAELSPDTAKGTVLLPLESENRAQSGNWTITRISTPEGQRKIGDKEVVWLDHLKAKGMIENRWNSIFFTSGASREPELAGIWGAVVGTFLTMLVTLMLSFPVGVCAAIYLEEFAPKNRLTQLIEVNINNLAAVPSIVFGLLGLAVIINFFGDLWPTIFARSAPLVGGMVLALMTLPTIIIASRAALKAVPPSIKEAALGIGASKIQAVFHHVLPPAMPGIMTGTIIGMAQALGETAPLLMIGMVAFIVDIPGGLTEPATVLPVQIFMWADFPEPGFQQKTAAAIMILLGFLILMNALAVVLRRRFERRW